MVVTENSNTGQMEREKMCSARENDEAKNEKVEEVKEASCRAVS